MPGFTARIRPAVERELKAARLAPGAFIHLERAHVLGQSSTLLHVRVHWHMLLWGIRQRSAREVFGQALRIAGAALLTPFGLVPAGNTGGANVSPLEPMPIPIDLQGELDAARH
ncbi:MAG: DUF3703 domain-containing protein [Betaproteobacteria bacterium]